MSNTFSNNTRLHNSRIVSLTRPDARKTWTRNRHIRWPSTLQYHLNSSTRNLSTPISSWVTLKSTTWWITLKCNRSIEFAASLWRLNLHTSINSPKHDYAIATSQSFRWSIAWDEVSKSITRLVALKMNIAKFMAISKQNFAIDFMTLYLVGRKAKHSYVAGKPTGKGREGWLGIVTQIIRIKSPLKEDRIEVAQSHHILLDQVQPWCAPFWVKFYVQWKCPWIPASLPTILLSSRQN